MWCILAYCIQCDDKNKVRTKREKCNLNELNKTYKRKQITDNGLPLYAAVLGNSNCANTTSYPAWSDQTEIFFFVGSMDFRLPSDLSLVSSR